MEWLGQELNRSGLDRPHRHRNVAVSGDEQGTNPLAREGAAREMVGVAGGGDDRLNALG